MGSRNHEAVPTPLISQIAAIRSGSGVHRSISNLAKIGLIAKLKNAKYEGYRLTYGGLDYLALHTHTKASTVFSVGNQIGVGKESDIFVCASESGKQLVLKIHRLGRISFRTVKANRDYLRNRQAGSWMYMSRLAALKEYEFMKALRRENFPVPKPIGQNRHTVIMELIDAFPLRQMSKIGDPASLYAELLSLIVRLAQHGLIHGDFNEFNILVEEREGLGDQVLLIPTIIDFPQMVSIDHSDAEFYFDRDVACIKRFFDRRFGFTSNEPGPRFKDATAKIIKRLDVDVQASGFSKKMAKELEVYMKEHGVDGDVREDERDDEEDQADEIEGEPAPYTEERTASLEFGMATEDVGDIVQSPADEQTSQPTHFPQMRILDIQDHNQLSDLSEGKSPPQLIVPTKAAKKRAGWAI